MMVSQSSPPAVHVIDDDERFRTAMIRMLTSAGFRPIGYGCAGEFLLPSEDGHPPIEWVN
jgi:FixJ family two-component response regulator